MALLSVIFIACAKSGEPQNEPTPTDTPVGFSASSTWTDAKATPRTTGDTEFASGDTFGVFAYYVASGSDISATTPNFMYNQKVTYDGSSWTYSPTKYWPATGTLSFFAYAPYGNSCITCPATDATGTPSIGYNNPEADLDLLAAESPSLSFADNNGEVSFKFHHILAKIKYKFTNSGNGKPVINALKYDIPYIGSYKFGTQQSAWTVESATHTLVRTTNSSYGEIIENSSEKLIDEFTAYILPCSINKFSISINNTFVDYTPSTAVTVKAGYQYTINFVLAGGKSDEVFITSYSMWESDGDTHDGNLN